MPERQDIDRWVDTIRRRYENYLRTSFYFNDPDLRKSFQKALERSGSLLKGPILEPSRSFRAGANELAVAQQAFPANNEDLRPALVDRLLWSHQEQAIHRAHNNQHNIVVATGTASGKTESFLYPILFELYQQYCTGELGKPGVRAMILYPMNALANDQRIRLGEICKRLKDAHSGFLPTFGQYIGQTPYHKKDTSREGSRREEERLPGELVFRDEMRNNPPHILLTNYSMLEYLLIRPDDSPLFDRGRGAYWKFIVLDEAHQYRGVRGMEMGMLIRRLKQRLKEGGYQGDFRCIATSATITSGKEQTDKQAVAKYAQELFGEPFEPDNIIFGQTKPTDESPRKDKSNNVGRYHIFLRALEGAFLIHKESQDKVVLNREDKEADSEPLEIALCKECGQHYYVGREHSGKLKEAIRDPSQARFGVAYYLPKGNTEEYTHYLCRKCGALSNRELACNCKASIRVELCASHPDRPDQLKKCRACKYQRGGIGDPVQEIVHGSDGPNAVIATALHELLPANNRKILAFADSRQEAAFFAWYAEDSYKKLRDRNLMLQSLKGTQASSDGLSVGDMANRLIKQFDRVNLSSRADSEETKERNALESILSEALTNERRISLAGVGLISWFIKLPTELQIPSSMQEKPWNLDRANAQALISYLLDQLRIRGAMSLPEGGATPRWNRVSPYPPRYVCNRPPAGQRHVFEWGNRQSGIVSYFLFRALTENSQLPKDKIIQHAVDLMKETWEAIREYDNSVRSDERILLPCKNGTFQLNYRWLRLCSIENNKIYICDTCAMLSTFNIRGICLRNRCPGALRPITDNQLQDNHYRILYKIPNLPPTLEAEEHTAQIDSDTARERQAKFKQGDIHLLSSSTTFEVGVDLGDLEVVFLRNVPPEPFNYTQRVGRAGRRETPGLAVTYCRRNPHDLYHYSNPEERIVKGTVNPPHFKMINEKIIMRHMVAVVLAGFFREGNNRERFKNVENLVDNWEQPSLLRDLKDYCYSNQTLKASLLSIVPLAMHRKLGLHNNQWIDRILGPNSRFDWVQKEVHEDYMALKFLMDEQYKSGKHSAISKIGRRMKTIAREPTLNFLSRKAVIPKYGFPVDVVELSLPTQAVGANKVSLHRDLSQAIAEYAPGGKVIANKKEWESCGIKMIPDKELPIKYYTYDDARNFEQWDQRPQDKHRIKRYLSPVYGFVAPLFANPKDPVSRTRRLYTTRPFFNGFIDLSKVTEQELLGVRVTKAIPGTLVILCEGHGNRMFYICRSCGRHMSGKKRTHKAPWGLACNGTIGKYALGHELVTDVLRIQFLDLEDQWEAYSLAYAVLLGAADTLNLPSTDLNVTITAGNNPGKTSIVLYDDVPGGAGLVEHFEDEQNFRAMLSKAKERVNGGCGCDRSCYGCLRSYRNQFAHPELNRYEALSHINRILEEE